MKNVNPIDNIHSPGKIYFQEFINAFQESLGVEGAEVLIKNAIKKAGLVMRYEFNKNDALKICKELKQQSGFVGIVGGILMTRFFLR